MIEILSSGAVNLIQDTGRIGHLGIGISRGGAMDLRAFRLANALAGNDENAAGIELSLFPFRLRFTRDTTFACTGALCPVELDGRPIASWWARTARAGQTLILNAPRHGARAYIAIQGGIDVPLVLGSRSTDIKIGFGGLEGRGLKRGDTLAFCPVEHNEVLHTGVGVVPSDLPKFFRDIATREITIRALPSVEYEQFTSDARHALVNTAYLITPDANRMGYRLSGEALFLASPLELLSHGIVPGTVQVPPSGQPIIQLADANTCGGYPKIANVISADLWKLAQAPIGTRLRFEIVTQQIAAQALQEQTCEHDSICRNLARMRSRG